MPATASINITLEKGAHYGLSGEAVSLKVLDAESLRGAFGGDWQGPWFNYGVSSGKIFAPLGSATEYGVRIDQVSGYLFGIPDQGSEALPFFASSSYEDWVGNILTVNYTLVESEVTFNSVALVELEHLSRSFLISADFQGVSQSSADLEYASIELYGEFNIFAEALADCDNAVLFLNAFFYGAGIVSSPVRTALGRGDWRRVVSLGVDYSGALNIEREQWRAEARGGWGMQQNVVRNRDLCPEIGEEVADAVYQAGGFLGPSNEIPEAAPVGNRGRIPAPSGQWFAVSRVRPVRHVDWEYCEGRAERCEIVPSEWRHSTSLVPYPHLFLQTNLTGSDCSPVNRLRNGAGPAMWIAHFKGRSIPDWKLIAAIILKPDPFYAIAIMAVGPMDNAVSEWGPWEPSEGGICNGVEFIQRSFDINKVRRPKLRKAIGTSLEECEYGLPWFDGVYDIKNWEMLVFDGQTAVRALWFDENEPVASALYLPVGENGASVFIG